MSSGNPQSSRNAPSNALMYFCTVLISSMAENLAFGGAGGAAPAVAGFGTGASKGMDGGEESRDGGKGGSGSWGWFRSTFASALRISSMLSGSGISSSSGSMSCQKMFGQVVDDSILPFHIVANPKGAHDVMYVLDIRTGAWENPLANYNIEEVFDEGLRVDVDEKTVEDAFKFMKEDMKLEEWGSLTTYYSVL
ncbi:hypothetical protein DFH09DRAFT_1085533 [Mycena vulgaris]|nr:hypothetical protein DFH09DRAFT_1085533 [Mycena vulgaris]